MSTLVDDRGKLLECVLLGFTSCGDYLVSYSTLDEGRRYELQIWTFRARTRSKLVATVPLFCTADAGGDHGVDFDNEIGNISHLRITVCESHNRCVLLVHGEPDGGRRFGDSEAPLARRCFLTSVPNPASVHGKKKLGATSMSYLSTSAVPFNPRIAGLIPAVESDGDENVYAVLNSGDSVIGVRVAPSAFDLDELPEGQHAVAGPRLEALLSVSTGPTSAVRWGYSQEGGTPRNENSGAEVDDANHDKHHIMNISSWTAMEADTVLSKALAATLRIGYTVVDYEIQILEVAHGGYGDQTSAIAAVISVLRARGEPQTKECPLRGKEGWRTVVSVVECPLGYPRPPRPRLLFSVEIPPGPDLGPDASASSAGGGPPTLRAVAAARAKLAQFRRAAYVPTNRTLRNGATLTNAGAVATGMSADALKHPTQPICVLGWKGHRT